MWGSIIIYIIYLIYIKLLYLCIPIPLILTYTKSASVTRTV